MPGDLDALPGCELGVDLAAGFLEFFLHPPDFGFKIDIVCNGTASQVGEFGFQFQYGFFKLQWLQFHGCLANADSLILPEQRREFADGFRGESVSGRGFGDFFDAFSWVGVEGVPCGLQNNPLEGVSVTLVAAGDALPIFPSGFVVHFGLNRGWRALFGGTEFSAAHGGDDGVLRKEIAPVEDHDFSLAPVEDDGEIGRDPVETLADAEVGVFHPVDGHEEFGRDLEAVADFVQDVSGFDDVGLFARGHFGCEKERHLEGAEAEACFLGFGRVGIGEEKFLVSPEGRERIACRFCFEAFLILAQGGIGDFRARRGGGVFFALQLDLRAHKKLVGVIPASSENGRRKEQQRQPSEKSPHDADLGQLVLGPPLKQASSPEIPHVSPGRFLDEVRCEFQEADLPAFVDSLNNRAERIFRVVDGVL
ncbi:MAG: hypothetical protein RLZZ399_444 [Verrucomicrobiota bacterium]